MLERATVSVPDVLRSRITNLIDDDIRDSVLHINRSGKQIDERISAVSMMGKHGRRKLHAEQLDLHSVVMQACADHEIKLRSMGGEIEVDTLPEIKIDKMSVQLIVENLIANAVKYNDSERPLRINVWADVEADGLVLHFRDNGRGIHTDDLSRVFVMFRRVGKQDTQGDGTGLAYSRTIANRLGGRIWCESENGQGSTFHVFLPTQLSPGLNVAANS